MKLLEGILRKKTTPPNGLYQSHIGQDQWVAEVFKQKLSGYFLDFGAFDGFLLSNTYYLERNLGWSGICVEPNPEYYAQLCKVRNCTSVNVALWPDSRMGLEFVDAHGLSCFPNMIDGDSHSKLRRSIVRKTIIVDTLNPTELLDRFSAPTLIEYMSLDVEGAEMDVLKAIDLDKYKIALMTIEHSDQPDRRKALNEHLSKFGYEALNNNCDDYFFNRPILEEISGDVFLDPIDAFKKVAKTYAIIKLI